MIIENLGDLIIMFYFFSLNNFCVVTHSFMRQKYCHQLTMSYLEDFISLV